MNLKDPRIEAYLNQEMSEIDAQNFEMEAKANPEVWEHIQFQQFMIQGIREEGAAELKDFIANRITEEVENDFTNRNIWWSVAATLIILVIGLGVTYKFQWLDGEKKSMASKQLKETTAPDELKTELHANSKGQKTFNRLSDTDEVSYAILSENEEPASPSNESNTPEMASKETSGGEFQNNLRADDVATNQKSYDVDIAPFVVSAIDLNALPKSKPSSNAAIGKTRAKAKQKLENSSMADTTAVYSNGNISPSSIDGAKADQSENVAARKKFKSNDSKQFLITLSEQSGYNKQYVFVGSQTNGKINLTLWNAGTSDVLIFQLDGVYYIQLGTNFYYLPLTQGSTTALVRVVNPLLLEKLKQ
jgi:hypothetical protein